MADTIDWIARIKKAKTLKALNAESGMGACMKFKFMCSQEASCQAWECKDMGFGEEDMM